MSYKISTDDLAALYKFDGRALVFRSNDKGETLLAAFSQLDHNARLDLARHLYEGWDGDPASSIMFAREESFPSAFPSECIIGLSGWINRRGMPNVPELDSDGFPLDPAKAMEVFAGRR